MESVKACMESCIERLFGVVESILKRIRERAANAELKELASQSAAICCDTKQKGTKVEVSRFCVSGEGSALATVEVEQEAGYWEVEVVKAGKFRVGVAHRARNDADAKRLDWQLGDKVRSWALASTALDKEVSDGDTIGVYLDQRELPTLKFTLNGEWIDESRFVKGVKGDVRPAVSVEKGAILKFRFEPHSFKFKPSGTFHKFSSIIPARNVLSAV